MNTEDIKKASVHFKLKYIQQKLKVNKDRGKGHQQGAMVNYEYRNAEDILEAVKPLCDAIDAYVIVSTKPDMIGGMIEAPDIRCVAKDKYDNQTFALISGPRFCAVTRAALVDCNSGESVEATSFAAVDFWRRGQTEPEKLCGSADSYATKYALQHLFALDNGRDDPDNNPNQDGGSKSATTPPATRPASVATQGQADKTVPIERKLATEAWMVFSSLDATKEMTKEQKEKFFYSTLKSTVGKDLPEKLSADDWRKVVDHLKEVKAA